MTDTPMLGLIKGYKDFYREYKSERYDEYRQQAAKSQAPKVMVIACSDSRVHPSIVMHTGLGEVFQVCNVANLIPPYRPDKGAHHSTSAALEFAVGTLNVEHVVIMGHSGCGGIQSLLDGAPVALDGEYSFISQWVDIATQAKQKVRDLPKEEQYRHCELEALKTSLSNLMGFPWIAERVQKGTLAVHAWHFNIETGVIIAYDAKTDTFSPLAEA